MPPVAALPPLLLPLLLLLTPPLRQILVRRDVDLVVVAVPPQRRAEISSGLSAGACAREFPPRRTPRYGATASPGGRMAVDAALHRTAAAAVAAAVVRGVGDPRGDDVLPAAAVAHGPSAALPALLPTGARDCPAQRPVGAVHTIHARIRLFLAIQVALQARRRAGGVQVAQAAGRLSSVPLAQLVARGGCGRRRPGGDREPCGSTRCSSSRGSTPSPCSSLRTYYRQTSDVQVRVRMPCIPSARAVVMTPWPRARRRGTVISRPTTTAPSTCATRRTCWWTWSLSMPPFTAHAVSPARSLMAMRCGLQGPLPAQHAPDAGDRREGEPGRAEAPQLRPLLVPRRRSDACVLAQARLARRSLAVRARGDSMTTKHPAVGACAGSRTICRGCAATMARRRM